MSLLSGPMANQLCNSFYQHPTINFTASWSTDEVTFLDTRIYSAEQHIETVLHVEPADTHQYLHTSSCHPKHLSFTAKHLDFVGSAQRRMNSPGGWKS